jgi:hypothetical protein
LSGHDTEASEAIEHYHMLPYSGLTIAGAEVLKTMNTNQQTDPRAVDL